MARPWLIFVALLALLGAVALRPAPGASTSSGGEHGLASAVSDEALARALLARRDPSTTLTWTRAQSGAFAALARDFHDSGECRLRLVVRDPAGPFARFEEADTRQLAEVEEPLRFIELGPRRVLTVRLWDGGSGGSGEWLRCYVAQGGQWRLSGEIALSGTSRSGLFPELCGAATPHEERAVDWVVADGALLVFGRQDVLTRLPNSSDRIHYRRSIFEVQERTELDATDCLRSTRREPRLLAERFENLDRETGAE